MPVTITSIGNGLYRVSTPNMVHAHGTTKKKALAMKRILDAYERKQKIKAKRG